VGKLVDTRGSTRANSAIAFNLAGAVRFQKNFSARHIARGKNFVARPLQNLSRAPRSINGDDFALYLSLIEKVRTKPSIPPSAQMPKVRTKTLRRSHAAKPARSYIDSAGRFAASTANTIRSTAARLASHSAYRVTC
jgi:hypothetical protein